MVWSNCKEISQTEPLKYNISNYILISFIQSSVISHVISLWLCNITQMTPTNSYAMLYHVYNKSPTHGYLKALTIHSEKSLARPMLFYSINYWHQFSVQFVA